DGSLDESLPPVAGVWVYGDFILQADGKIITRSPSYLVNGVSHSGPARILSDGTVDATFNLELDSGVGRNLALQADGKFLAPGTTTLPGARPEFDLYRFHIGPAESTLHLVN